MPDPSTTSSAFSTFTPDSEDRRQIAGNPPHRPGAARRWLAESAATLSAVLLLCGGIGSVVTVMGFKLWGPTQEAAQIRVEVRQRDSTLTVRVIKLEDGASRQLDELRAVKEDIRSLFFLQCESMRRSERGAPTMCFDILQARRPPR
jgi:hypothetical protein